MSNAVKDGPEQEFYSAAQGAKLLGVSTWTLYDLKRRGLLNFHRVGDRNSLRFTREDLLEVMRSAQGSRG